MSIGDLAVPFLPYAEPSFRPCLQVREKIKKAKAAAQVHNCRRFLSCLGLILQSDLCSPHVLTCLQVWRHSTFKQRRLLLNVLLKYIIRNQESICRLGRNLFARSLKSIYLSFMQSKRSRSRDVISVFALPDRVASIDSGKPMVDAAFGEVMVTCEKIAWLIKQGERHLKPDRRSPGVMVTLGCHFVI